MPQRYHDSSPPELLPLGVKQILITGTKDSLVPPKYGKEYEAAAQLAGDKIEMIEIEDAGHFEVIAPNSAAWPTVEQAVQSLVKLTRKDRQLGQPLNSRPEGDCQAFEGLAAIELSTYDELTYLNALKRRGSVRTARLLPRYLAPLSQPALHERHTHAPAAVLLGDHEPPAQGLVDGVVRGRFLKVTGAESLEIHPLAHKPALVVDELPEHGVSRCDGGGDGLVEDLKRASPESPQVHQVDGPLR